MGAARDPPRRRGARSGFCAARAAARGAIEGDARQAARFSGLGRRCKERGGQGKDKRSAEANEGRQAAARRGSVRSIRVVDAAASSLHTRPVVARLRRVADRRRGARRAAATAAGGPASVGSQGPSWPAAPPARRPCIAPNTTRKQPASRGRRSGPAPAGRRSCSSAGPGGPGQNDRDGCIFWFVCGTSISRCLREPRNRPGPPGRSRTATPVR